MQTQNDLHTLSREPVVVDQASRALYALATRVASTDCTVLINGEPEKACDEDIGEIAGKLFTNKGIVRLVRMEGVNDPVSITPGVRQRMVRILSRRIGIPHHIEPVPCPAFAVLWIAFGQFRRHDFQCNLSTKAFLHGQVDFGHAAFT